MFLNDMLAVVCPSAAETMVDGQGMLQLALKVSLARAAWSEAGWSLINGNET